MKLGKRFTAWIVMGSLCIVTWLAGCDVQKTAEEEKNTSNPTNIFDDAMDREEKEQTEDDYCLDETPVQMIDTVKIGCGVVSPYFHPFQPLSPGNEMVMKQTQVYLLMMDRGGRILLNAKDGQTTSYAGQNYTYYGMSNVSMNYSKESNRTTYTIQIRDDVRFSDGKYLTADDVIFTLYALCDPSYEGESRLKDSDIVGLKEYLYDNYGMAHITNEMILDRMNHPTMGLKEKIRNEVILPLLKEEAQVCQDLIHTPGMEDIVRKNRKAKDLLASIYRVDTAYRSKGVPMNQVIEDLANQYVDDYQALARRYGKPDALNDKVRQLAVEELLQEHNLQDQTKVASIRGITKLADDRIEIITEGYDDDFLYDLIIPVYPLHYYGDSKEYDYDEHRYGFTKGDLSFADKKESVPLGAGPYKFLSYENNRITLSSNHDYYLGSPAVSKVEFCYVPEEERVESVTNGLVDLVQIYGSKDRFLELRELNKNQQLNGEQIKTCLIPEDAYGYIGINPQLVNIDGEPYSKESIYLRKAIACILAVYRNQAVEAYYGDAASVIQYPALDGTYLTPVYPKDYVCYGMNLRNKEIYSNEMNDMEKQAQAEKTAKSFLRDAGLDEDKLHDLKQLHVYVNGLGQKNHPDMELLENAKQSLKNIGIRIKIHDTINGKQFWKAVEEGKADLWCGAWKTSPVDNLASRYLTNDETTGIRCLRDEQFKEAVLNAQTCMVAEEKMQAYQECYNYLIEKAVEVPVYQKNSALIYRTGCFDDTDILQNNTKYWNWEQALNRLTLHK